jgi:twitching motility protein PilT
VAQLDTLLRALTEKGASELKLIDGQRPTFRFADGDRPVSQTVLMGSQISALLAELAGHVDAARIQAGEPASFTYSMDDGSAFLCEVESGNGAGLQARVQPTNGGATAQTATPVAATAAGELPGADPNAPAIDRYLRALVDQGGSDLHLSADETPMIRVDGSMARLGGASPLCGEKTMELLREIMPEVNRGEFDECHDTDFAYEIEGLCRFRVNAFYDRHGPGGVMRIIPSKILTTEDLNIPPSIVELCNLSKGLVLVTGPTGSGKSTTLAALVDHVNRNRPDHIITIEDPIEFVHPNHQCLVNQREIRTHTGSFKRALRAALRQDPDIVLVGEMRDLETVEIAIETAETGHLVFGTLHTTTAASTVDRIIDQFPADRQGQIRTMLSESLKGVVSQTLLKKNGGGRVAALETLIVIPAIANLIREGKTFQIPSTMQTGKKYGMVLLNDALMELVRKGLVDPEEAYRKAIDKVAFANALRVAGFQVPTAAS